MNIHPSTIPAADPPDYMSHAARGLARTAAIRVKRLYPGVVGEVLAREIDSWVDMGFRLDRGGLMQRLIDHILEPAQDAA